MRIAIIGANAAGTSAASQAKRRVPHAEVVLFERGAWADYDTSGIPYNLADDQRMMDDLVLVRPDELESRGIDLRLRCEVTSIDVRGQRLRTRDLRTGAEHDERFDSLVIATGACAQEPPIEGLRQRGVFLLRSLEQGIALKRHLAEMSGRRAVVVGAGCMGIQIAEALRRRGLDVLLLERVEHVLPSFALPIADLAAMELEDRGVGVITGAMVRALRRHQDGAALEVFTEREQYPADVVVVAAGLWPNVSLAARAGIHLGDSGAIRVDDRMQTSAPGIFAAGDCAQTLHRVTRHAAWIPLQTTANKQGQVAGANAAGARERFPGVVGTLGFKVFGLEVARTGLTLHEISRHPVDVLPVSSVHRNHGRSYGHARAVTTLLYVDRRTGRLVGAQMAGAPAVAKRIDVLATCITAGLTVDQIAQLDLSYSPPFSPIWDPVLAAAITARRALTHAPPLSPAALGG